jgi:hypothetical protein
VTPDDVAKLAAPDAVALYAALTKRFLQGTIGVRWRITAPWCDFAEDELTLGEVARAEELTGVTWGAIDIAKSARHLVAVVQARMEGTGRVPTADAVREIAMARFTTTRDWLSHEAVGGGDLGDPKGSCGDGSTPTT